MTLRAVPLPEQTVFLSMLWSQVRSSSAVTAEGRLCRRLHGCYCRGLATACLLSSKDGMHGSSPVSLGCASLLHGLAQWGTVSLCS